MLSPNAILTTAAARPYFAVLDDTFFNSPVFQDMLDDAMSVVNETLGLDLSGGPGVEVTQVFQPDTSANAMLRMVVPMDPTEPLTIQEGPDQRVLLPTEFTAYVNMIRSGGVWSNFYYFDRGHAFGTNFVAPVTVTYTPRDSVFRLVKTTMLDLVRLQVQKFNLDPSIATYGFATVSAVKDDTQQINFDIGNGDADYYALQDKILNMLLLKLRGPRIG